MTVPWSLPVPECCAIPEVGKRGITLKQLRDLACYLRTLCKTGVLKQVHTHGPNQGKRIMWTKITMLEICLDVVKPVISHLAKQHSGVRESSWVELVASGPQVPKIFVSHSWAEPFRDFMLTTTSLMLERGLTARDVMWICTFANNQFELSLGTRLLDCPFFQAAEVSEATALFLDRTASSLRRSWCTFELAITTDTADKRLLWDLRQTLADERKGSVWDVSWDEVEKEQVKRNLGDVSPKYREAARQSKPLMLCTPGGLVGTRRVTSGPLLEALQHVEVGRAEASSDVDRRRVMNYIAYSYYNDEANTSACEDRELDGIVKDSEGNLQLQDKSTAEGTRRLNGRSEYQYEIALVKEKASKKFKQLDENIRRECQLALEAGGLFEHEIAEDSVLSCKLKQPDGSPLNLPEEQRALTLAQLRILHALLEDQFEGQGGIADWKEATQRHLWSESLPNSPEALGKMLPEGCSFSQCFQEGPQFPDVYVSCPWDLKLVDIFAAIEWHAEARGLPDRATYYINGLCRQAVKTTADTQQIIGETSTCLLVILDNTQAKKWHDGALSLFCLFELFLAYKRKLGMDFACSTGTVATNHPFESKAWAHGDFDKDVAWNLAQVDVKVAKTICTHKSDRDKIMSHIVAAPGGIEQFEKTLGSFLPMCSIGPALLATAYLDNSTDYSLMRDIILMLTDMDLDANSGFLLRMRGTFGETALHVTSAAVDIDDKTAQRCLDLLLNTKMDPNVQDKEGETALHWAATTGNARAIRTLMRNGANPSIENYKGDTALDVAVARPAEYIECISTSETVTCLELWVKAWNGEGDGSPQRCVSRGTSRGVLGVASRPVAAGTPMPKLMEALQKRSGKLTKKDVMLFISKIHNVEADWAAVFPSLAGNASELIDVEDFLQEVACNTPPVP